MVKYPISNLNEIPIEIIEKARRLGNEFEAEAYLNSLVTPENSKYLRSFVRRVVTNGEEVSTWMKGRALIAYSSLKDQLTKEKEKIFGYKSQDFKTFVKPTMGAWNQGSDLGGMFVFCEPKADYRSNTPSGYGIILLRNTELIEIEPIKATLQFRRWLASRMAFYLKHYNQLNTFSDSNILEEIAPIDQWTQDAVSAFEGLAKEKAAYCWGDDTIPGFCGDNAFYGEI